VAKKKDQSFVEPAIQRRHIGYGLAVQLVQSGVKRFHRIERIEGLTNLPEPHEPTIIVGNHQNGLMDAIVQSAMLIPNQIHFLTRADVFSQKTARALLFSFNQMPIYRQRDKLSDARERNKRIFEICAARLNIGATIGLFPEGNHRAVKTLRPMRRGVVDMVNSALKMNPEMKQLKLVPVGIDYEQMTDFRRRLSYRVGAPVRFDDLIDPATGEIPPGRLLERLKEAMDELLVNIQPESHYEALLPYVRAIRTTETNNWAATRDEIRCFQTLEEEALRKIEGAYSRAATAGVFADARPEDLGKGPEQLRVISWWFWPLAPFALIGGACAYPFSKFIGAQAEKRVKDPCFKSTFKVSAGMFLFPIYLFLLAWPLGRLTSGEWGGWPVMAAYVFNLIGSRFAGWWYGLYLDWNGKRKAEKVYSNPLKSEAWTAYIAAVTTHLKHE